MIITVIAVLIIIIIIVKLCKSIAYSARELNNTIRSYSGKDSAELENANLILEKSSKNNLILKWAAEDAIKELTKYYDQNSAVEYVSSYLTQNGLKWVDVPRSFYMEPGSSKEELAAKCNSYFNKFNYAAMNRNGSMSKNDVLTSRNLSYMWFFADDSITSMDDANKAVNEVFGAFCESYAAELIMK